MGYFDSEDKAARAFDIVSLSIHGDLARTNFPSGSYDRRSVTSKPLEEVLAMARAMSRKRRKGTDGEKDREHEIEALKVGTHTMPDGTVDTAEL